jgi:hypothetical protein
MNPLCFLHDLFLLWFKKNSTSTNYFIWGYGPKGARFPSPQKKSYFCKRFIAKNIEWWLKILLLQYPV